MAASITPYKDGPLIVRGDFAIRDRDGADVPVRRPAIALCRCGRSLENPFCDGTHKLVGFRAAAGVRRSTPDGPVGAFDVQVITPR